MHASVLRGSDSSGRPHSTPPQPACMLVAVTTPFPRPLSPPPPLFPSQRYMYCIMHSADTLYNQSSSIPYIF